MFKTRQKNREPYELPHIGQRIIKTTIAVFLCLLIYRLRGYQGQDMRTEAAITAIVCMQPYIRDTRDYAVNRFTGTIIGAAWGLLLLLFLYSFPILGTHRILLCLLMAAGVMMSLYTAVLVHKPDTSALAAIIFLCVVISYPDIDTPFLRAGNRILDIFIGTAIAVLINSFRLPRTKNPQYVFFVRSRDLVPDRFSALTPAVLFRLNHLHDDGARICLISDHAPAFFTQQMSAAKLNVPLIVMDGAAIFDIDQNAYLGIRTIPPENTGQLKELLKSLQLSYFVYTIHNNRTCIFHHGELREEEQTIYSRMKRSPYRDYLEGEIYDPKEIVYYKIIVKNRSAQETEMRLQELLPADKFRYARRKQAGADDLSALYIYDVDASVELAINRLMVLLRKEDPSLVPVEIHSAGPYRSEHDAMHLLHTIEKRYEPVVFFGRRSYS